MSLSCSIFITRHSFCFAHEVGNVGVRVRFKVSTALNPIGHRIMMNVTNTNRFSDMLQERCGERSPGFPIEAFGNQARIYELPTANFAQRNDDSSGFH